MQSRSRRTGEERGCLRTPRSSADRSMRPQSSARIQKCSRPEEGRTTCRNTLTYGEENDEGDTFWIPERTHTFLVVLDILFQCPVHVRDNKHNWRLRCSNLCPGSVGICTLLVGRPSGTMETQKRRTTESCRGLKWAVRSCCSLRLYRCDSVGDPCGGHVNVSKRCGSHSTRWWPNVQQRAPALTQLRTSNPADTMLNILVISRSCIALLGECVGDNHAPGSIGQRVE